MPSRRWRGDDRCRVVRVGSEYPEKSQGSIPVSECCPVRIRGCGRMSFEDDRSGSHNLLRPIICVMSHVFQPWMSLVWFASFTTRKSTLKHPATIGFRRPH